MPKNLIYVAWDEEKFITVEGDGRYHGALIRICNPLEEADTLTQSLNQVLAKEK